VPYIETQEPLSMAAAPLALLETLVMDGPPVAVWPNRADPRISESSPHKQGGFMQISVASRFYIKVALKSRFIQILVKHTGGQKVSKNPAFSSWHPNHGIQKGISSESRRVRKQSTIHAAQPPSP
jgi:hypothetical protein